MYGVFYATSFLDLYRSPRQVSSTSLSLTVTVDTDEQYLFLVSPLSITLASSPLFTNYISVLQHLVQSSAGISWSTFFFLSLFCNLNYNDWISADREHRTTTVQKTSNQSNVHSGETSGQMYEPLHVESHIWWAIPQVPPVSPPVKESQSRSGNYSV